MFKVSVLLIFIMTFICSSLESQALSPSGKTFGFGIMLGEPTGITAKLWTAPNQAWAFSVGNSYLGKFRLGADYLWHFDAFNSSVVKMYAGPGVAVGVGESGGVFYSNRDRTWYKTGNELGVGVRGLFGINIIPTNSPIEIFTEIGVLVGLVHANQTNVEGALGIRYYF